MLEFMLVMPVLLTLIYGSIEVSRLVFIYSSVNNGARTAARYGSVAGLSANDVPRFQDCEGIRATANQSAFITNFDEINITYDRGVGTDGKQIPISNIDPNPQADSCPILKNNVRNGDRIIVQVSASYKPIISFLPIKPLKIVSASARTFLTSVSISGSAAPTGFSAETSTPSLIPTQTTLTFTPTLFASITPLHTIPPNLTPSHTKPPTFTFTPSNTPLPTYTPSITPTAINCTGITGVSHGALVLRDGYMEMEIYNNTGYTLSTASIYLEWNHDKGHKPGDNKTLRLRQATLASSIWNGDVYAPSTYLTAFYPAIPTGTSAIRFIFHQPYNNADGAERILIILSTPGCVNYPLDSRD